MVHTLLTMVEQILLTLPQQSLDKLMKQFEDTHKMQSDAVPVFGPAGAKFFRHLYGADKGQSDGRSAGSWQLPYKHSCSNMVV